MKHTHQSNRHKPAGHRPDRPVFRSYSTGTVSVDTTGRHGPATRLSVRNSRTTVQRAAPGRLTIRTRDLVSIYHLDDTPDSDTLSHLTESNDN